MALPEQPHIEKKYVLHLTYIRPGDHLSLPWTAAVIAHWPHKDGPGVFVFWQVEADHDESAEPVDVDV